MAGDQVTATASYFYETAATNNKNNSLASDVVGAFVSAIMGSPYTAASAKAGASTIGGGLGVPFTNIADPDQATTDNTPRAYLSVLFFDERFHFVGQNSQSLRVSSYYRFTHQKYKMYN